jgi:hypothetical protein
VDSDLSSSGTQSSTGAQPSHQRNGAGFPRKNWYSWHRDGTVRRRTTSLRSHSRLHKLNSCPLTTQPNHSKHPPSKRPNPTSANLSTPVPQAARPDLASAAPNAAGLRTNTICGPAPAGISGIPSTRAASVLHACGNGTKPHARNAAMVCPLRLVHIRLTNPLQNSHDGSPYRIASPNPVVICLTR